jgi:CRP/FNR family cyclic AMP-dependent transcriptional regulator
MSQGALGKVYYDRDIIVRQGEAGDGLFVIQEGQLEILSENAGRETRLRVAGKGELIGEMAVFDRQVRSATVRALGEARVLTVDRKNFLRRINEDPSLAFRIVETMSRRIRELSAEVVRLTTALQGRGGD